MKYLSLEMVDDALYLAVQSKIPQLLTFCKRHAKMKKDAVMENLLEMHEEKTNPSNSTSLIKAMTQIANFSGKQLRKEDYNNLFKDFETLIKIDDITDLELKDFNGWEIDLEQYQKALDLEFQGKFKEAEEIYEKNDIKNDVQRVQNLQTELYKELRQGEKYLTLLNMNEYLKNYKM